MKRHYIVFFLGVYMIAMGVAGYVRTGSWVPLVITGAIGLVTIFLGIGIRRGSRTALVVTVLWFGLNVMVDTYLTIGEIAAHPEPREGSQFIFGSMALLSLIALVLLLPELRRRHIPPNL